MYIPALLQDNAPQIRDIDPDARQVRFDKEAWQDIFRQVWEVAEQQVPNYHRVLEEFPDGVLTAASLSRFRHPPIQDLAEGRIVDLEGMLRLKELCLLTIMWTYGQEENGLGHAAVILNRDGEIRPWVAHNYCYYGGIGAAYMKLSAMMGAPLKAECCTNFLYFLCRGLHAFIKPLPVDKAISIGVRTVDPAVRTTYIHQIIARDRWEDYAEYLMLMHNWASLLRCRPDQVVEFLRIRGEELA